jgi:hypothetical protein
MKSNHVFSKAVLAGLEKQGLSRPEICRITGVSQSTLQRISSQKASFKDGQLELIERATGRTVGQLAVMSDPAANAPLAPLMNMWARTRSHAAAPRRVRGVRAARLSRSNP